MKEKVIYKRRFSEMKDPFADMSFEKKFIGKDLKASSRLLSQYSLDESGIYPVIDNNQKILGFIYDSDSEDRFMGHKISDMGLFELKNFGVYQL